MAGSGWESGSAHYPTPGVVQTDGVSTRWPIFNGYVASALVSAIDNGQDAMGSPRVVYKPRPDATLQSEINALSAVYKFVVGRKAAARGADGGEDALAERALRTTRKEVPP